MREYKINRDSIKHLLETPPCVGVDITETPMTLVQNAAKIFSERKHEYIMECIVNANIDPDALIKTAKKNQELMEELAKLYNKIEDGTLVELPCKVGDKTFLLLEKLKGDYDIVESKCVCITDNGHGNYYSMYIDCVDIGNSLEFDFSDFGKTVFLTAEEAERVLAERSENAT